MNSAFLQYDAISWINLAQVTAVRHSGTGLHITLMAGEEIYLCCEAQQYAVTELMRYMRANASSEEYVRKGLASQNRITC